MVYSVPTLFNVQNNTGIIIIEYSIGVRYRKDKTILVKITVTIEYK